MQIGKGFGKRMCTHMCIPMCTHTQLDRGNKKETKTKTE